MKICNLDYLKSVTPGSNAFAIQVIKLFLQDTPIEIEKIKAGLTNSNYEEIYKFDGKKINLPRSKEIIPNKLYLSEHRKIHNF